MGRKKKRKQIEHLINQIISAVAVTTALITAITELIKVFK